MKVKRDQLTGIVLMILAVAITVLVFQFKKPLTAEYPGPKLFPLISAFGFAVCGLGIFLNSTFSKKEEQAFLLKEGWIKVAITFSILCLYVFLMKYFGYMIVTPFAIFAFAAVMAKFGNAHPKLIHLIIFSLGFSVFIYVMYVNVFGMTLPSGSLF